MDLEQRIFSEFGLFEVDRPQIQQRFGLEGGLPVLTYSLIGGSWQLWPERGRSVIVWW